MKKTISMFLCGALVFNSISTTVLANGYDGISEVQENEASVDISETENADINNKYLEFIERKSSNMSTRYQKSPHSSGD